MSTADSPRPRPRPPARPTSRPAARNAPRTVAGVLPDGTIYYVPRGEVRRDADGTCCHLCGFWFRSLSRHLATHGWTADRYANAFALDGSRGLRDVPDRADQRRTGEIDCPHAGTGPRRGGRWGREQLRRESEEAARRVGAPRLGDFVLTGVTSGLSLAELSRRAGLPRQWLDRHLADVAPEVAEQVRAVRSGQAGATDEVGTRWLARLEELGFTDPALYLRARRSAGWSWARIATEGGVPQRWLSRRREQLDQ